MDVKRVAQVICAAFSNADHPIRIEFTQKGGACTNGTSVYVSQSIVDSTDPTTLTAVLLHEAGHIRFTEFSGIGKMSYLSDRKLLNAIEDARIEECIRDTYAGAKFILNPDTANTAKKLLNQIAYMEPVHLTSLYVYALLSEAAVPELDEFLTKSAERLSSLMGAGDFAKVKDFILEIRSNWPASTEEAALKAKALGRLLRKIFKQDPPQDSFENQQGSSDSDSRQDAACGESAEGNGSEDGKSGESSDGKDRSQDESQAQGQGQGNAASAASESNSSGQSESCASSKGENGSGANADPSEGNQGSDSDNAVSQSGEETSSSGQGYSQWLASREAVRSELTRPAGNPRFEALTNEFDKTREFKRLDEQSQAEVCEGYSPNPGDVYVYNRERSPEAGREYVHRALLQAQSVGRALRSIVETTVATPVRHTNCGRLVDRKRLAGLAACDPRIFLRKGEEHGVDTAVMILLDRSGSMGDIDESSLIAALSLTMSLRKLPRVKSALAGFPFGRNSSLKGDSHFAAWSKAVGFDESVNKRLAEISELYGTYGGTPIEEAITGATRELLRRPETRKVLLCVTDGYFPRVEAAEAARKAGIATACLSLNLGSQNDSVAECFDAFEAIAPSEPLAPAMFRLAKALRPGCR